MATRSRPEPTKKFHKRKDMILRAAVEVLNKKGVKGMTLADVASKLDLVPTAVMYYFRSKEELAASCFHRSIEVYDTLATQAEQARTAREALEAFVRGFFEHRRKIAIGEADQMAVFNDVRAVHDPGVGKAYEGMFRRTRSLLMKSREFSNLERVDCNARIHLLLSQLFWSVVWIDHYDADDYGRLADHALDILESGLAHNRGKWSPQTLPSLPASPSDRSSESRETFLRAATVLINEQGYLGASVQKISEQLNVTKGAFYHHNDAKDDLVEACFARTLEVMRHAQRAAASSSKTGYENLASVCAALLNYQLTGSAPLLRTSALTSVPENIHRQLIGEFDRISGRFALVCSDGIADGSLRAADATIAAQMITAMINASAELHLWAPGVTAQNGAEIYARPLFEGLLTK
ncbi:AcrR family transcriptional regulator [Povalibacter uvarum]|uniref:AcrR family transcriptional regulator n=1 Tax=Povalibacter uvarum TaxID=732238 RepID=A0A841HN07_9GAMM|nr:TetR/AcrR family transcriptional regulator [Povalibacter uvarum]MBB6093462.1 AcrR family transcriptional regulator [Povalibacter uvarum]